MSGAKSIFYLLSNAAAVTAIVGTSPKRIFPNRAPQVYEDPYITYMQIGAVPTDQKDAVSGFDKVDFDVDCWCKDYTVLNTLAAAVRAALDFQTISSQGDNVDMIRFVREFDGYDEPSKKYHKAMQFRLIIKR